ncbi:ribose 5-phosphate isomerase A [Bathymodiolus platifrons methanotrophic gill symbiont]|uniref:ribose-5-phosphate isomerase RpiA n=1 Tax=Bathymodiolus platifrons methanotrophic gill symbiont TaxID=113268 RepID=UPI000B4120B7|nr:ribose-5-phosphate isomerase RpiA [Bathymodiolus platifrons methanotrophic gill symbiont]MCK5869366.1 ribose-5-phosphate isomerase RpiA [Methyloprofundus sp.]TXK95050.1 ribose 5-phosphate isomerase A [Methylococcaceae bacterium CS4]TXK96098.1 ribose 5-phosphate isomerase A [Methylococcaceae bacterium CS5]TXK99326.1 ribose 5-phosphate isomerase A [Methylococcaceae bacterium HT1]TXL06123.1 ribose 5-phosphate isomerase A [Methylococcaceae bacterium CS3]TXL08273.1 ribose 5-phosphate isomerase 
MTQDESKRKAAEAALPYIKDVEILGVGTGSTVNHFIDCLADFNLTNDIKGAVSSSIATTERLKKIGIPVMELSESGNLDVYVDGADEVNPLKQLIKGGGGALTREKIIAGASEKFICIVDESKTVKVLGDFPLPIEVIPMARSYVAREIVKLGGQPIWRENYITDNGCEIIDVHNMEIAEPLALERLVNNLAGVVSVGIFGLRPADVVLIAKESGVETM